MHRRTESRAPPVRHHSGGDALQSEASRPLKESISHSFLAESRRGGLSSSLSPDLGPSPPLPSPPPSHVSCVLYLLLWLVGGSCRELRYMLRRVCCIAIHNLLMLILIATKGVDRCDWWHRETCVYLLSVDMFILVLLEVLQKFYRWSVLQRHRI